MNPLAEPGARTQSACVGPAGQAGPTALQPLEAFLKKGRRNGGFWRRRRGVRGGGRQAGGLRRWATGPESEHRPVAAVRRRRARQPSVALRGRVQGDVAAAGQRQSRSGAGYRQRRSESSFSRCVGRIATGAGAAGALPVFAATGGVCALANGWRYETAGRVRDRRARAGVQRGLHRHTGSPRAPLVPHGRTGAAPFNTNGSDHGPLSTGIPSACHSGNPSSSRRAFKPRARSCATASKARTQ